MGFVFAAAAGAALVYFFDPQNGRRRRALARDRSAGLFRSVVRRADRVQRHAQAEAYGASQRLRHLSEEPKDLDDATLAHKVESELFRDADVPKGAINVNAERGVVFLRGEVQTQDLIADLEERARKVHGVEEVENLLHLPGAEAPMHDRH